MSTRTGILILFPSVPLLVFAAPTVPQTEHTFSIGTQHFLLDGKPLQIRCGEIHAPRVPREYCRHRP